jgi:hypothetical protein
LRPAAGIVALLLVLAVPACGGDPPGPGPAPARVVTVVQDDAELLHRSPQRIARTLDDLRDLGVDWVRVTAGWSVIAPSPAAPRAPRGFDATDPDAYPDGAWDALDRLSRMTRDRGMRLNVDIAFWAPRWATADRDRPGRDDRRREAPDADAYADFAEAVARRYARSAAFTVWNEPNHNAFLLPQWDAEGRAASPAVYRAMLRAAVPRIRRAAPDALVLIGATSSVGTAGDPDRPSERMSPLTFARELACVDEELRPTPGRPGCAEPFAPLPGDGWSHHPYPLDLRPDAHDPRPETVRLGDLDRLGDLLDGLHERGRTAERLPMYLTEFGYQTNPPDPTWDVTTADQARWLPEAERVARADPRVRATSQFLVRDLPERPDAGDLKARWRDYQSGLRFEDGRAKPAHAAFALALSVRRATDPRRVAVWGLVRPGEGPREAVVERLVGGRWERLGAWTTGPDGTFSATVTGDPEGTYRLRSGKRTGPGLRGSYPR